MIAKFIAPLAHKVILGLLLALSLVLWRADSLSEARDRAVEARIVEEAKHAVTRASVTALEGRLDAMVEAGQLTEQSRDAALATVAIQTDDLRKRAAMIEAGELDYREAGL